MKRAYLCKLMGILALMLIATTAKATDILVDGTDKAALEAAITASQPGDVIIISESISLDSKLTINKAGLYFKGVGDDIAIQPASGYTERLVELVPGNGNRLTFENLTFTGANNLGNAAGGEKDGGFGRIANGTIEFIGCKLTNNYTAEHGAAFDIYGGSTTFTTCEISGNRAGKNGGSLRVRGNGTQLILQDGTVVTGNQSGERGAAIYAQDESVTTVTNCEILANTSPTSDGGAFASVNSAQVTVSNSKVNGNSTIGDTKNGGAFWMAGTSIVTIDNSEIKNNSVLGRGGAFYAEGGKQLTVTNSKITGNKSTKTNGGATGGAFDFPSSIVVNISNNSEISGNETPDRGGAFSVRGTAKVSISDSKIFGNSSTGNGGAFFLEATPVLKIDNCEIANNETLSQGGAFSVDGNNTIGDTLYIRNSTITGNKTIGTSNKQGGAFYLKGISSTYVYNSEISNNKTPDRGGAFSTEGTAKLNVYDSKILNNTAYSKGGAFEVEGTSTVNIYGSLIKGNSIRTAVKDEDGNFILNADSKIQIYGQDGTTLLVADNTGAGNGAVFATTGTPTLYVEGTSIIENESYGEHGGIMQSDDKPTAVSFINTTIANNKKWRSGDSMFFLNGPGGTFNFINTTVAGNRSGSATFGPDAGASTAIAIREPGTKVNIINSILAGNSTKEGKAGDLKIRDKVRDDAKGVADVLTIQNSIVGYIIGLDPADANEAKRPSAIPGIASSNYNAYIQNNSADYAWQTTDVSGINWEEGLQYTAFGAGYYPVAEDALAVGLGDPALLAAALNLDVDAPLTDQLGTIREGETITSGAIEYVTPILSVPADFTIENLRWTPVNPAPGDGVTFFATIKNNSIDASPADSKLEVEFQVNGATVRIADEYAKSIPADEEVEISSTAHGTGALWVVGKNPTYTVRALVNAQQTIEETDYENNASEEALLTVNGKADVKITHVSWDLAEGVLKGNLKAGNAIVFSAVIDNQSGVVNTPTDSLTDVIFFVNDEPVSWNNDHTQAILVDDAPFVYRG
ncbi:MAG: hypothetical protein EZS26_001412 [Candidatus Ordinivivax streblomastigis]|uniref:CARDB domain-containing protein n=1 Tax=Candidatus Ordinivivax streblomastigis TaxID=2540710 RepID=A0A5M8P1J1_9BACT|nr:MAG: hypothetical protein EZS26_001412 [Candidatus Ordinivivax streblomastigis]